MSRSSEIIIQQAGAELDRFHEQWWGEYDRPYPSNLYHYTSLEGLVGILTARKFFLSDVLTSSDRSELRHGLELATEVLRSMAAHPMCASVRDAFDANPPLGIGQELFVRAVCFCPGNDVLTQWRGYSADGGFALGVDFGEIVRRAADAEFAIGKMLYDHGKQKALLKSTLDHAKGLFDSITTQLDQFPPQEAQERRNRFVFAVGMSIMKSILRFKNEAFYSENEWRILTVDEGEDLTRDRLKFRARGRTIVPYVELPFAPDLITHIYRSPGPWPESIEYGVRRLAASIGPHVVCEKSQVPL